MSDIPAAPAVAGTLTPTPTPTAPARPVYPVRFTAAELAAMTFDDPVFLLPGLVPTGLGMIVGKPKSGKSFWALDLAYATATGGEFLARTADEGDVLYFALEDHPRRLQGRLEQIAQEEAFPDNLEFVLEPAQVGGGLEEYINEWYARVERPRLVVLDTMIQALPEIRGNDVYGSTARLLNRLQRLALDLGITVLVVHHARKDSADLSGDVFDSSLGTTAINGAMDGIMVLVPDHNTPRAKLALTGRDFEECVLDLVFDGETATWMLAEPNPLACQPSELLAVIAAVRDGHATPQDIATATGKGVKNVQNQLKKALARGLVRKVRTGVYTLSASVDAYYRSDSGGGGDPSGEDVVEDEDLPATREDGLAITQSDSGVDAETDRNSQAVITESHPAPTGGDTRELN